MAQVPYDPVPQGAPGPLPTEGPRVDTPGAAFGTNIGEAIQRGGAQVGQAGNELFQTALQIQQLKNEATSRDRQNQYAIESSKLHAEFGSKTGKEAADALPGYLQATSDLRARLGAGLNPMARKMYDADSMPFMQRNVFNAAAHAAIENKRYDIQTLKANGDIIAQGIEDSPDNYSRRVKQVGDAYEQAAMKEFGINDPNDPVIKDARFKAESSAMRRHLEGMSKTGRSMEARQELQDAKLTDTDRDHATSVIDGRAASTAATTNADTVFNKYRNDDGTYKRTTRQMQDEVRDMASNQFAGNKDMIAQVSGNSVAHLDRLMSNDRLATRIDDIDTRGQISQIVAENGIRNAAEFSVDPKGAIIYNKMTPAQRRGLDNTIVGLNNQAMTKTDETLKHTITGKRNGDLEDYLNQNPYDPKWHLSLTDADKIAADQAKIVRKPTDNPAVTRGMKYLQEAYGPAMEEAGLMFRDKKNPDDYDHFMGALQAFIEVHRDETGKPVTHDDLDKEWPALIRKQMTKGFWARTFGGEGSPDYVFKQWQRPTIEQVPEEYRQLAIGEAVKAGGAVPSEQQIYHRYLADTFNKLFQTEQKEAAGGGPPRSR